MICSPLSPPILGARSAWRLFTSVLSFLPFLLHAADPFADIVRKTEPLTPEQERLALHLPPGFEIQLVAAEPEIGKPINLAFDAQGRLWLTQSREYPYAAPLDKPGRDMIKVLSDLTASSPSAFRTFTSFATPMPMAAPTQKISSSGASVSTAMSTASPAPSAAVTTAGSTPITASITPPPSPPTTVAPLP